MPNDVLPPYIAMIQARFALLDEDVARDVDAKATIDDAQEHFSYQQAQSQAHASGVISTEDAQIVYMALGETYAGEDSNGGWQPHVSTAAKVAILKLMEELISLRLAAAAA